jgi:ribosomal protein L32
MAKAKPRDGDSLLEGPPLKPNANKPGVPQPKPDAAPKSAHEPNPETVYRRERRQLYPYQQCPKCHSWKTGSSNVVTKDDETSVTQTRHRFCFDCRQAYKHVDVIPVTRRMPGAFNGD